MYGIYGRRMQYTGRRYATAIFKKIRNEQSDFEGINNPPMSFEVIH